MTEIFKALSEENRLRILSILLEGEMCVCEIEAALNLSQSNASRHLTALKQSGILESSKKAQWTYYRVRSDFIRENGELWDYLKRSLKRLPSYDRDYASCRRCRELDLCNCGDRPR